MQPRCLAPAQVSTEPSVTTHRQGPQQSAPTQATAGQPIQAFQRLPWQQRGPPSQVLPGGLP